MKRQKALNRISRYHDAIGNSMNNNVFIYVLQEKDKFLCTAEISLKRRFSFLSVSRNSLPLIISKKRRFQLSVLDLPRGTESIVRRH